MSEAPSAAIAADQVAAPESTTTASTADAPAVTTAAPRERKPKEPKAPKAPKPEGGNKGGNKGQAESKSNKDDLGITHKKTENFADWYAQVVTRAEMIEYYDISGCYILRPWAYQIWEYVQEFIDTEIKKLGVKNSYFPMFVPRKYLEKEKDHVEGFAAEVAWVTHSGSTKLEEPIAVRPTSETIMYPVFAKWIRSHRDLPMKLNQWCNVVRWEFKYPTPFIRSREFLWQEGHTVHATKEEADVEVLQILDIYARAYSELLAVHMVKGKKTEHEKFAGGLYTTTIEGYIPVVGRGIQAATSHCLGTNFARMFDISYLGNDATKNYAWQNSWGFTTRSIGVMIMTHADDIGLVLPPRVAPIQVVIVPIYFKEADGLNAAVDKITAEIAAEGVRVEADKRENYKPGWKFAQWEMKGVPVRIEVGMRDLDAKEVVVSLRHDASVGKFKVPLEGLGKSIKDILDKVQHDMLARATKTHKASIKRAVTWKEFMEVLSDRKLAITPWCGDTACEKSIKTQSAIDSKFSAEEATENPASEKLEKLTGAAKSLCIPFEQPEEDVSQHPCVKCGNKSISWVMFGRSY